MYSHRNEISYNKRVCFACGSTKTVIRKTRGNRPEWTVNRVNGKIAHVICCRCKREYFIKEKYTEQLKKSRSKNIRFKSQKIKLDRNPRVGVCNWCRAVAPFDTYKTHMHHEQYHEDSPTKDMIEVCISCHMKETNKYRTILRDKKTGRIIKPVYS